MRKHLIAVLVSGVLLGPSQMAFSITLGQVDDFQDGTTQGWSEGPGSPNPPFNNTNGGPEGIGDHSLRNISSGSGFSGSKMVMFNDAQWTGDYTAAGVDQISMLMRADSSGSDLIMRVAIQGALGSRYVTDSPFAFNLANDDAYHPVVFNLNAAEMVRVRGTQSLADVLLNVTTMRILHATAPAWRGGSIPATLDVDNITALSSFMTGDMDCDGDVDFDDIDDFVLGLNSPQDYENQFGVPPEMKGDTDGDGDLDFDDIDEFVSILNSPLPEPPQTVPEPGTATLLAVAISVLALYGWQRRALHCPGRAVASDHASACIGRLQNK